MKQTIKRTIIVGAAIALVGAPIIASAEDSPNSGSGSTSTATASPSPSSTPQPEKVRRFEQQLEANLQKMRDERQAQIQDKRVEVRQKLDDAKKKACENHQATINRLMDVMDKRRENTFDRITKISDAVQAFYVKKQLTVTNYDDLVAAVAAAKTAAQTATASQLAIPALNCDGDHPRADVADFKEKRAGSIDAMRAYRDAVKELVKAVKTAAEAVKDAA